MNSVRVNEIRREGLLRQVDLLEAEVIELESMYDSMKNRLSNVCAENDSLRDQLESHSPDRMVRSVDVETQIQLIQNHLNTGTSVPIIQMIKLIRTATNPPMGLREAKQFVDAFVDRCRDLPKLPF